MSRFDDLDRAVTAYFDIEAAAPAPQDLLERALTSTQRRRPRPAWIARLHAGGVSIHQSETTRTLGIAAAVLALLLAIAGLAIVGGSQRTNPLTSEASVAPSTVPSNPIVATGPIEEALRATWVANTRELPQLGAGAGPVSMTIAANGTSLTAANFAPGATFDSTVSTLDTGDVLLVLDRASGGCDAGAEGTYRWTLSPDGATVTMTGTDACPTRQEALARTWVRSLAHPTSRGAGFVTTMDPAFQVTLPDQALSARTLDDFIEIGGENGFSLMAFKNPVGFVDSCSSAETRLPFTPGAKAFADYLESNRSLVTKSRDEVTIGGLPAIHVVTDINRTDSAPCDEPSSGLYLWTPKDCSCHFVGGGESLYIVDLPSGDTMMFEVSPIDAFSPVELQVSDSIRIPASLPAG